MLKKSVIQHCIMALFAYSSFVQAGEVVNNARGIAIDSVNALKTVVDTKPKTENVKGISVQNLAGAEMLIIEADQLEFELDRNLNATGNAMIKRGKQTVSGDNIIYDLQNDELNVKGNANISLGDGKITGPELSMSLDDNVGEMKDASVQLTNNPIAKSINNSPLSSEQFSQSLGNLQNQQIGGKSGYSIARPTQVKSKAEITKSRADAELVLFEGQDKKRLKNVRYTTCEVGVDDWYIKAKDLTLNDRSESGVATNATIEFKGVPFLYTPWMSFSYNNQRKSGLLAPTYGTTSSSGFELLVPYYWNISPNMDATLAARVLSKRGVQLQGEFRYLTENYSGIASVEYLPGDNESNRVTGEEDRSNDNRYFANFKHQHNFGGGWSGGYGIEKVSDDQYFSDLSTRIVTTSRVLLPQQFYVNYNDAVWNFNGLAQKYQTLDDVSYPYERLPQLTLTGNKYYGDWHANLYSQVVAFDSSNPNVKLADGVRTTLYPSISYELTKPYGYLKPKIGLHYTNYNLNNVAKNLESQTRTLPILSLDGGLYFDRKVNFRGNSFVQTLEPRMFYVYIPDKEQDDIPIFDTSEMDLNFTSLFNENQFTGNDRINNAKQLSFGLSTRFIDEKTGFQRLSASIGQRYYYADQVVTLPGITARQNNSSDILAGVTANLQSDLTLSGFWQYNTNDDKSVRSTITSRYTPEPGKSLNLSYSYRADLIDQFDISGQWPLGNGWYGMGRMNYSFKEKRSIESLAGLEYDAGCWLARTVLQRVSTATSDANYALFFQLELGGLASIGANPMSVIKRNIPGFVSSSRIPDAIQQPYYE
jgi:LPS-assembly protein